MVLGLLAAGAAIAAGAAMNDAQSPKNNDQSWNPKGTGYTDAESLSMRVTQYITQGGRPEYQNATSHPKTLSVYNEPYAKQNGNEYGTFEFYKAPDGTFTRDLTRATDISFDNKSGKVTLTLPDKWANDEVIKKITDSYSLEALSKNYKNDKNVQYQDPYDETKKVSTEKYIELLNSALKDRTTALEATAPTKANLIGRFGGSDKRNKVINGLTADDVIVMSADGNSEKTPLAIPKWMETAYPELTRLISYKNGFVKPEDFRNEFYNIEKGKITESQANAITETVRRMLSEDVDDMTPEEYARTLALYNYLAKHDPVRSGWQQFISAGDSMAKQFYSGYYNNMYDWVTGTADLLVNAANFSWATGNSIDLYDALQQENDFGRALEGLAAQDYEINSRINFNSLSASDAARLQANILAKATQTVATMAAFQYASGVATNAIINRGATKLAEEMVSGGAASAATGVATAGQTAAFNQAAGQALKQAVSKASTSQLTQRFFSMTGEQLRNAYNLAANGTGAALNGMSITQMTNVVNSAVSIANSAKWANTALNALSMVTLSAVVWNQDLTRKVMSSESTSEETALWIRQTIFDTAKMAGFSALGNVATNELVGAYKGSKLETAVEGFKQAASKKVVGASSKISAPWLKFRKWWLSRKMAMDKQVSNATATSYEAVREAELLNEARANLAAKSTTPPNQMTDIAANMGVPPVSASAQVVDPVSGLVKTGVVVNGAVGTITPYQEGQANLVELENQLTDWSDVDTNVSVVMNSITHPDIEPVMSQQVSEAMKADSELLRLEEEAGLLDKSIIKSNKKLGKEEYNFIYSSHSQASAIYATRSWELQIIKNEALANGATLETYKPYLEAKDRLAKAAENLPANIRLVIDNKVIPSFQRIEYSFSSRMTYDWHVFPEDVLNGLRASGKWGTDGKDWLRTVARKDLPKGTYTPYSKVVQRDNTLSLNRFRILEDDDITWIGNGLSELIREAAIANAERGFLKSSIKATGVTPEVVVSGEKTAAARSLKEYRTELNKEIGNGIRSFKEDMKMSEGVAKKTDLAKNLAKEEVATTGGVEITEPEELKVVMEDNDVLTTSSIVDQQSMNEFYNQSSPEARKIMRDYFSREELVSADSAKTIKKTRKEWKENPIYDEDYSAGRAEDVMEGRIPLEDYLEEQKERMWEAFKKSNQGTETFYHRDENGQIDRRDTVSYNGTLYRGLYSEYGGKPTKAEFGEAFDDVIKKGSESKYYSGFKEFDYDGDFDRGYNAGNEEIDNILSIKATAEPASQKAIIETSEQHFDVVSYDKLQRLIASDEANNDFSHIGILDRIDKANALASEKVKSSSQIKEASEQYSQLQKEMQRDANGIEDYSYMAVDKSASPLQKFADENKLALPDDKRPLKGKVKHALWAKVQDGEELPKIKGIKKSDISKEMDKKDFYKMLDETDLFKNASGPNPLKYDLDEEKLLGDVDKSIDGMIDFVKTNKKASLAVEGIANLQGVPMTDTRFEFIVLDNILNKEGESIFGKTLYDVSKNIVDENIPKTAVVIKGNLDTLYGKVNKAIKDQMISRFAAAKNALESAGEAVDSATVTQLLDKYNEEIVGAKTDPVVVKTTNDKGEIEFLRVSPTIADIYNNRPIYTPMSTPMQLMANMALLKRISITNLNPRSFSKQAASDTAMAFATVGAFPGTFNAIGDDLSLRFGDDIAEYFRQNDPTRYENIKAIADRDGITLAEAAVKNSEAIGNVQLPFNTMNQEALKQANVGKYGTKQAIEMRRKTAIQKMNDGLRKASDKLGKPNDKREEYARKLAGQKAYRDALDKGYNPEQADQFRRQAIDNATTNFRQKHTVFNNLRITTPYLTSGISGAKSFWKMFELDPVGVTSRIFTGFIVPIMYFMGEIVKDEELRKKYESLAEYEKANHIIIAINGDLIGIPVGEELGQITNIVSHIVESMHGENQYNFWNLMLNDVVGLLPGADLTGFTDPEMWDNISGQAPSFLEVMDNGISSVLSSTMPPLAQSLYMATSGRDLYTGKRIDTSKVSLDADGNPVIQSYTQSQFAKAMSNIIGGDARVIEKVTSGLFGTTALHVLDTVTSAIQFASSGGQEGSLTTAVEKAIEDITKPYALNGYSGLDKRFIQEVHNLEEKKRDIEYGDPQRNLYMKYNQEIAKETDPKKRQELINKRNGLLSEYQKQIEQLIKSYRSKGGSLDRYKFSLVTGLLTFEDAIRADRTFLHLNTESSNAEAQALATLYSYGVTNPDAPSSLGYIYFDKDGNAQLKMWTPSQMKIVNDSFYAQGDIHTAQIKAIIDDRTDNSLSNQLKAERKAEDPYWNKAKMTDDDYDAIDDLRKAYNAKVVLALEDYMNTYGAANVLSNDAVMDYLNDIIRVPSSYEKVKGRFVSSDNGKLNKQTGFAESYIKTIFGVK